MKKITTILSLVAIAVSALFVACAEKKEPDLISAFPSNKLATYAPNETTGVHEWKYEADYKYTLAKGGGFGNDRGEVSVFGNHILEYRITPNFAWTAELDKTGKEYLELGRGYTFNEEDYTWGTSGSGDKGMQSIYFRVIKTPEVNEEAVVCTVYLKMQGQSVAIATLTIEPKIEVSANN